MRLFLPIAMMALIILAALPATASANDKRSETCGEKAQPLLSRFLDAHHRDRSIVGTEPSTWACKAWPEKASLHLVASVYDTAIAEEKRMLVALLDLNKDKILATYWAKVDADATTPFAPGSLDIDTAPYYLKPGMRAFGIDVDTASSAGQESGHGRERTLYVREGTRIRPVLDRMPMSRWRYVKPYRPYANSAVDPRPDTEDFTYTISIAPTTRNGWADLRITRKSSDPNRPTVSELLHYDGQRYPGPRERDDES